MLRQCTDTRVHEAIDQPVPIICRFDNHADELLTVGLHRPRYLPQIVGQALVEHDPIFLVTDDHDAMVRMQVYAAIFHVGLLRVKVSFAP